MGLKTLKLFTLWLLKLFAIIFVVSCLIYITPINRDDTDKGMWGGGRSGIKSTTDALTGCQYLVSPDGGITPRLSSDGNHICARSLERRGHE
jgi:hypothetical protein